MDNGKDVTSSADMTTNATAEKGSKDSTDWEENVSLLSSDSTLPPFTTSRPARSKIRIFIALFPWITSLCLAAALIYVRSGSGNFYLKYNCVYSPEHPPEAYSPAAPATEYVPVYFRAGFTGDESPYQGWPNDEKDELWQELYHHGVTLRISADEHKSLVNQTIRVPIAGYENDYFGGLDVFHQLHCLNQIRMGYYPRRYNTSMTNPDGTVSYDQWLHIDHCIESLRQSIMCHSDIGFNTFKWLDDKKITQPMLNDMHMCRNFDKIREWAFDRYVSLDNRRAHVENGVLVDYSSWGPDPDSLLEGVVPKGWNYTVDDL